MSAGRQFLVAEYCPGPFYWGWHLYLRESRDKRTRNRDGGWGWIMRPENDIHGIPAVLAQLGIVIRGDGTMDNDGIHEIAKRWPVAHERIGRKPRGCVPVDVDDDGHVSLPNARPHAEAVADRIHADVRCDHSSPLCTDCNHRHPHAVCTMQTTPRSRVPCDQEDRCARTGLAVRCTANSALCVRTE